MIRVWGHHTVANVQKVLWCLREIGVEFSHEGRAYPDTGRPRDDRYLAIKQRHTVPFLEDGALVLWEGNVIVRYLSSRYGLGTLCPEDPARRADAERWMDYQLSTIREHIHPLMRADLDASAVAHHSAGFADALSVVDAALSTQPYLGGENFSMADIPIGIMAFRWSVLNIERVAMPNMDEWFSRISDRPAFRASVTAPEDPKVGLRSANA